MKHLLVILIMMAAIKAHAQTDAALQRINELGAGLEQSSYYPTVHPDTFMAQLARRVKEPYKLHQGRTLFCWAAIPIAFLYQNYPVDMVDALFSLYKTGSMDLQIPTSHLILKTSRSGRSAVGGRSFSGRRNKLRGQLVDQMVFLAFAENYGCLLNLDPHYNPGDQVNPLWASATLHKEQSAWEDLGLPTTCYGSDFSQRNKNIAEKIQAELAQGKVVSLYLNSLTFFAKSLKITKTCVLTPILPFATHFVQATGLEKTANGYTLLFWDRNGYQSRTVSARCFERSIFGYVAVDNSDEAGENKLTAR